MAFVTTPVTRPRGSLEHKNSGVSKCCDYLLLARSRHRWILIGVSILVYFAAVVLLYSNLEGWSVIECIYFAVVVVTTVGYGDLLPTSDGSKIATVIIAQFALITAAFAISETFSLARYIAMKALRADDMGLGIFNQRASRWRSRYRSFLSLVFYLSILVAGTLVFANYISWEEDAGNKWVNGLYLTVITVTTIGFGDFSPVDTPALKIFGCLLMLIGIPAAASFLTLLTHQVFGEAHDELKLRVIRDHLTPRKFKELTSWVGEMRAGGVGNYRNQGENQVSRFEYLCFVLVKNGVVTMNNINEVMKNLDEIDTTGTGFLSLDDVEASASHFRSNSRHTAPHVIEEKTPLSRDKSGTAQFTMWSGFAKGNECVLAVPTLKALNVPPRNTAAFFIRDLGGKPVIQAEILVPLWNSMGASVGQRIAVLRTAISQGDEPAAISDLSPLLAYVRASFEAGGRRSAYVYDARDEILAHVAKDPFRGCYVLTSGCMGCMVIFTGNFLQHQVEVSNEACDSLAEVEPCSVDFDSGGEYYKIRVVSHVDVRLLLCGLLAIEHMEAA